MNLFAFSWRDFKKQKVRSIFGIGGILISMLLLNTVGILIDSLSYSYLDVATAQVGSADIIFTRTLSTDLTFDPYMDQSYIENTLDVEEIDYFYPRILMLVDVSPFGNDEETSRMIFYGINTTLEQNSGRMGNLYLCDPESLEQTDTIYEGPIPSGHCIILKNTAKLFNVTVGDWLILTYSRFERNVTIDAICVQDLRFTMAESSLVITELPFAQSFLDQPGKVNYIMATLRNREYIYDTRDIEGTTARVRAIGSIIQEQLGFDYQITLPKMSTLEVSEMVTMMMQVMLVFVSILSMMISGILINSILSTSIEERIRDFGIMRVLGGKKRENNIMVLYQGLLMGLFGTVAGIILAIFIVPWLLTLILQLTDLWAKPIPFIVLPATIIQNFAIGILVTLFISIWPAMRAGKFNITSAIDPFKRNTDDEYELKKEGSANTKVMLMGASISTVGVLIFILFPRIIVTQNMSIVISLFIGLLLAVLIGMVFAFLGVVPVVEWLISQIIRPLTRKYYSIVKLSLKRNRRRNTGNVLMFALTFSFIFFMSTFLSIRSQMMAENLQFQYGADLVVINQGSPEVENAVNFNFYNELTTVQGIKNMAPVMHNTIDVAELLSIASVFSEGGFNMEDMSFSMFSNVFNNNKIKTYIADPAAFKQVDCGLIGINQSYVDISDHRQFIWDTMSGSNTADAFSALFDKARNDTIIISKNIADYIGVTELGQKVRLVFVDEGQDQWSGNATTMTVVGITGGMPGFWNFRSSQFTVWGAGVMCSIEHYLTWMKQGSVTNMSTPIDKILMNLDETDVQSVVDTKSYINSMFEDSYEFIVDDNISKVTMFTSNDATIDLIMQIILMLTVIISLFGLISTMYSSMLERMFEIGLLRAMGLRSSNVRGLFISESLITMLGAGTMGLFIGSLLAYLMVSNISIITEMPTPYLLDIGTLLRTYLIAISVCVAGVIVITRKITRWSIVQVMRKSF